MYLTLGRIHHPGPNYVICKLAMLLFTITDCKNQQFRLKMRLFYANQPFQFVNGMNICITKSYFLI